MIDVYGKEKYFIGYTKQKKIKKILTFVFYSFIMNNVKEFTIKLSWKRY